MCRFFVFQQVSPENDDLRAVRRCRVRLDIISYEFSLNASDAEKR